MANESEEITYYLKIILVLAVIAALLYGVIKIWKMEAFQDWLWGAAGTLAIVGYAIRLRLMGSANEKRRNNLIANGQKIMADFVSLDVVPNSNLITASHYLTVKGIDPISGEEQFYTSTIVGLNEEPKQDEIPRQFPVYIDPANPDNYYVDVSELTD
jgi:hypothetical protein